MLETDNTLMPLFPARQAVKWGFINDTGEWVIPAVYDAVLPFNSNTAAVIKNGTIGFVDLQGNYTQCVGIDAVCIETAQTAFIGKRGKEWFVIGSDGQINSSEGFNFIYPFSEDNIAVVERDGQFGYISSSGEVLIKPCFQGANSFCAGVSAVKTSDHWKLINSNGQYISNNHFEDVRDFSACGLAVACQNNRYGYIDRDGDFVIPPIYLDATDFYETEVAWVRSEAGWSLINTFGEILSNDSFDDFEDNDYFDTNMFAVRCKSRWGVINDCGMIILEPQFSQQPKILQNGFLIAQGSGFRYVSKRGNPASIKLRAYLTATKELPTIWRSNHYVVRTTKKDTQPFWDAMDKYKSLKMSGADIVVVTPKGKNICAGKFGKYELIGNSNNPYRFVFGTTIAKERNDE